MNQITTHSFLLLIILYLACFSTGCSDEGEGNSSSISISFTDSITKTEGEDVTFVVSLTEASTDVVTVDYATENGTATAGADYVSTSGTLTFQAGETSKSITVNTLADSDFQEADKEFTIEFSNANNASLSTNTTTVTLLNLEEPSGYYISGNFNGEFKLISGNIFPSGDAEQITLGNPPYKFVGESGIFVGGIPTASIGLVKIFPDAPDQDDIINGAYNEGVYPYGNYSTDTEGAMIGYAEYTDFSEEEGISWVTTGGNQSGSNFEITSSEEVTSTVGGLPITTRRIRCSFNCTLYSSEADPIVITDGEAFLLMPNTY